MYSFGSQKDASFPSWEFDGPFSRLAQRIQVEQYQTIRTCLGDDFFLGGEVPVTLWLYDLLWVDSHELLGHDFFLNNDNKRIKAAKGMIFLKELSLDEFFQHSRELRKLTENF